MDVKIKSINPTEGETGTYEFKVELEVGGESHREFIVSDPSKLLDFQAFQIAVANYTGCYLDPEMGEDWKARLKDLWGIPQPRPREGLEDIE
jgi:hypothetical protein